MGPYRPRHESVTDYTTIYTITDERVQEHVGGFQTYFVPVKHQRHVTVFGINGGYVNGEQHVHLRAHYARARHLEPEHLDVRRHPTGFRDVQFRFLHRYAIVGLHVPCVR